ncbi:ATP-dependent DNA helicase RecG [Pseudaquidulcibacter saccharophilus]|uniref:ATP-dependent DNA helicase RecG n=1 Tax=Pseudaquidulcibacter saccharophilus TaxID=2831900 RepID=UPI001EFF2AC5|nr:ATP-dependent DNA helicase RecG [Pseudaquidulcibacter saccharophilus]
MRPSFLNPMFLPVIRINGVGPKTAPLIEKAIGGDLVKDAALHLPFRYLDRRFNSKIADAKTGTNANFEVFVDAHEPAVKNRPYRVRVSDDTGFLTLVFFNPNPKYLASRLPIGATRIITGEVIERYNEKQMMHPSRILDLDSDELNVHFEPVYANVASLSQKTLGKICKEAARPAADFPDWLSDDLKFQYGWQSFGQALQTAHNPQHESDILPDAKARERLAFDELLARQLTLQIANNARNDDVAEPLIGDGKLTHALIAKTGYVPTNAQARAFNDIATDLARTRPMLRLLQGDVGAGKTLVAAWGCAKACEAKMQSAFMAPTEILATQHFNSLNRIFEEIGIRAALLSGKVKGAARRDILEQLEAGEIDVLFGTHALFQEKVIFKHLAFVVIDEQHRFGVNARRALLQKGRMPHLLSMSATPIPRTLSMALYGDMDTSILDEKPKGREEIATRAMPMDKLPELEAAVRRAIQNDDRVYWICPLVEESENLDVTNVLDRFNHLKALFGDKVALIHGRLKAAEKDAAMERFRVGDAKILVATTVIEVGVDVKEASIIIIEHSERFGLAQLHQLRGRVGRGDKKSHCLLLYQSPLGETAKSRIETLRDTNDGFAIAEKDFELRGGGDLLGLKQTGLPNFKIADIAIHKDILPIARSYAKEMLKNNNAKDMIDGIIQLFDLNDAVHAD